MRRLILTMILGVLLPLAAAAQMDTVYVSDKYTTHFIFTTDINYADLSNAGIIAAKVVEESKNILALKAKGKFATSASVSVEESDGAFHTYILLYRENPETFLIDTRKDQEDIPIGNIDTVYVSDLYTTHFIFATDINYADISATKSLTGKLVEQGRNKLAIKARAPFTTTANVSIEESNGLFHTFILAYRQSPEALVIDTRDAVDTTRKSLYASAARKSDAPQLKSISERPQSLHHIMTKKYKVGLKCENIFSYSDLTYIVLSLDNRSSISYNTEDALFSIESIQDAKKRIKYESYIQPKNRFGGLSTPANATGRVAYSFDKITLTDDQVLKIYLYEVGGNRNLVMTVTSKDINNAVSPY